MASRLGSLKKSRKFTSAMLVFLGSVFTGVALYPAFVPPFNREPHYSPFCRWEQQFQMRELRRLLRASAEQAGWNGEATIDASDFQRDQTSYHYRKRADFSFHALKTSVLIDVDSLAIKDVHHTARRNCDGHIRMQVFRRNAEDLCLLAANAN